LKDQQEQLQKQQQLQQQLPTNVATNTIPLAQSNTTPMVFPLQQIAIAAEVVEPRTLLQQLNKEQPTFTTTAMPVINDVTTTAMPVIDDATSTTTQSMMMESDKIFPTETSNSQISMGQ